MRAILSLLLAFALPALGQAMEPGEWEFQIVVTAPGMPKPQPMAYRHCVTAEQAKDRCAGRQSQPADRLPDHHAEEGPGRGLLEDGVPQHRDERGGQRALRARQHAE